MSDIKYIEIKTVNRKMKLLYGDKLTGTQKAIGHRSNGLHSELRFSDRYGRISFSCTLADGVGGCRFKMIGYSTDYQWSTVRIAVTAEQEVVLLKKACKMADISFSSMAMDILNCPIVGNPDADSIYYGPNHIKYDRWGASFAFISKLRLWRMHPDDMICNEAVATVMLEVWPDLLIADKEYEETSYGPPYTSLNVLDPADLTPDQLHYLVEYYFERISP